MKEIKLRMRLNYNIKNMHYISLMCWLVPKTVSLHKMESLLRLEKILNIFFFC